MNKAIFIFLACLVFSIDLTAQEAKDTANAVVMYGEVSLLDEVDDLDSVSIAHYRDSLLQMEHPPVQTIREINTYLEIPHMSFDQIFHVVDSLFELDTIPYPLITQINIYIAQNEETTPTQSIDTSQYPADFYYHSWITDRPNPYKSDELLAGDSTLVLPLVGENMGNFEPPIIGTVTSGFGWRDGRNHNGMDIDLEVWDTVKTSFSGMVRVARYYGGYGRVVVVRHHNGLETLYAHLHRIKVEPGQLVKAGELIGLGGSSGHSTGSHLHWEIRFKGVPLNPAHFIDFEEFALESDSLTLKKTKYGYAAFPSDAAFHTVEKGDFLYKIAEQYGTSIQKLCKLNGIRRNSILVVGQHIRII